MTLGSSNVSMYPSPFLNFSVTCTKIVPLFINVYLNAGSCNLQPKEFWPHPVLCQSCVRQAYENGMCLFLPNSTFNNISLKSGTMGIFTPWKLANSTNQGFFCLFVFTLPRELDLHICQHTIVCLQLFSEQFQ